MAINRATAPTERRPRARRRTTRRWPPRRRRRAPACRVRRRHRPVSRGDRRQEGGRRQSRRRRGARQSVRPARLASRATPTVHPVLSRVVDAEFARLLAGVFGAGGPTRTLTATSLFWLLLYVGWRAGLGVEAALLLSAGAALGALATRGSGPTADRPAPPRSGHRRRPRDVPRDCPSQSTGR